MGIRIGVDTGGTFTDVTAFTGEGMRISFKLPSTPGAPESAILEGVARAVRELGGEVEEIVHGTTVATNALLERKLARTALVTTEGFEDVLEIGRQARPDLYNPGVVRPEPLIPRELRFGAGERVMADGTVRRELSDEEIGRLAERLRVAGVESVAICLLFSFVDSRHEERLAEGLGRLGVPLSVSHRILPEYREYERTSTVAVNACLAPRVSRYLGRLAEGLGDRGGGLRIMQSSGGSISAEVAAREPVRTILSGPAGGVVAATMVAGLAGFDEIVTFDMGGTSTDVAVCRGGAATTSESRISGVPVAVPVLDIHTVGAGGGSLARVDAGGALRVGPESAGADPGPACYGRGEAATVTDANLVLGRFAGSGLLDGAMPLDMERARQALGRLAGEMAAAAGRRVTPEQAALGVVRVANSNMERALRLVSVERGHDPRRFTLVSFGGAGGLHAAALADALRLPRVLIPADPGAFSALGVLLADVVRDYSRTVMIGISAEEGRGLPVAVGAVFAEMEAQAVGDLRAEGFEPRRIRLEPSLGLRYRGQSFEIEVPAGGDPVAGFHRLHRERYGHASETAAVEIVSLRLRAIGVVDKPPLAGAAGGEDKVRAHRAEPVREAPVIVGSDRLKREVVPVYERSRLSPGATADGPAVVIEYGSTTFIPRGWSLMVDLRSNMVLIRS